MLFLSLLVAITVGQGSHSPVVRPESEKKQGAGGINAYIWGFRDSKKGEKGYVGLAGNRI